MQRSRRLFPLCLLGLGISLLCLPPIVPAASQAKSAPLPYIFAWPFLQPTDMQPRGGTSRGTEVRLATEPSSSWQQLQQPALSVFQRDRAAILAMAGDYRASFDFLETVVFDPKGKPARPYQSWSTERVYIAEDTGRFISLQHMMVVSSIDDTGQRQGPFVQKHWRQDWQYEPEFIVEYQGQRRWRRRQLNAAERAHRWSQTVYQVDDTPRYASTGQWQHTPAFSSWQSGQTWRPLPRREHTVRQDYDVVDGRNRHTILPTGWVHEQDNLKLILDASGQPDSSSPYRAREIGVNRYERLDGFDFSAGDRYWSASAPFWALVRQQWTERFKAHAQIEVSTHCQGVPAFVPFFRYANALVQGEAMPQPSMEATVEQLLQCIVKPLD